MPNPGFLAKIRRTRQEFKQKCVSRSNLDGDNRSPEVLLQPKAGLSILVIQTHTIQKSGLISRMQAVWNYLFDTFLKKLTMFYRVSSWMLFPLHGGRQKPKSQPKCTEAMISGPIFSKQITTLFFQCPNTQKYDNKTKTLMLKHMFHYCKATKGLHALFLSKFVAWSPGPVPWRFG